MTYEQQQVEIKRLQGLGKYVCSLPFDQENCDECEYRDKEWEELLGERLKDTDGTDYFLRKEL